MIALITLITPFIVSALTQLLKKLPTFVSLQGSGRTAGVRLLAAFISLAYILVVSWKTGALDTDATTAAINTVLLTFITWASSLGIFHGLFQKSAPAQVQAPVIAPATAPSAQ